MFSVEDLSNYFSFFFFFHYFVSWRDRKFLSLLARCWRSLLFQGGEKKKARVSFCPSSLVTLFSLVSRLAFKVVVPQRKFLFFFHFSSSCVITLLGILQFPFFQHTQLFLLSWFFFIHFKLFFCLLASFTNFFLNFNNN